MKKNRIIALLLAMLLVLSVAAGCNSGTTENSSSPSSAPSTSKSPETSKGPEQKQIGELPLVEEEMNFSMWGPPPRADSGMMDMNDSIARQELQRRTNVSVKWEHPSLGQEVESFNLMLASNSFPDACIAAGSYIIGGWDKQIDDEFALDLTSYVEYFQNYMGRRKIDDQTLRDTVTNAGRICFFIDIRKTLQPSWIGPGVRKDLLDEINMDIPVTFDEYEAVLTAFKDQLGIETPLMIMSSAGMDRFLMSSFDMWYQVYQKDGVIHYPAYDPEYKDYLMLMNRWYNLGLIDQEFFSKNSWSDNEADLLSGKAAMTTSLGYINVDRYDLQTVGENVDWYPLEVPKKNADDTRRIYSWSAPVRASNYTTNLTTAVDPEKIPVILQYFDYLYSDEGSDLANYGVLHESYDLDANGEAYFLDVIYNNPDGMSFSACMTKYAIFYSSSSWYDWEREITPSMSEKAWPLTGEVFDKSIKDPQIFTTQITVSAENASEYSAILGDLKTYVEEMTANFILGRASFDEYDSFVTELENLKVNRLIELMQGALTAYLSRDLTVGY